MSVSPELKNAYRHHRQRYAFVTGASAIALARADVTKGVKRYTSSNPGAGNVSWQKDKPGFAWIENTESAGLRLCGFSDEIISRMDHKGWFTNDFEDGVYRGAVWQLPGKNGRARYVAGYADPDNEGAAFIYLSPIIGDKLESSYDDDEMKKEAARNADSIAETSAEEERDYQNAWQAGSQYAELQSAREEMKTELRELLGERRGAKACVEKGEWGGAFARAIDAQASDLIRKRQDALEKMRAMANGDGIGPYRFGSFWTGDEKFRAAFCDGASISVFPKL